MALLYRKEAEGIVVTGCDSAVSFLRIPEEIEGLPVRGVERSAFARRQELVYVQLPQSLRYLGRFAFYGCQFLETAALGGSITDYGDGVFRQCGSLREFRLDVRGGDCTVLREILADRDTLLRVTVQLPRGEVCLTFPDYVVDFDEDTHARVLHTRIEGAGFAYRECVSRKDIDLRAYDAAFSRIRLTEPDTAAQIALDRLCRPCGLDAAAKTEYESFLAENGETAVRRTLKSRREEWLRLLMEKKLLSPAARELGLRLAAENGETAFAALLMQGASPAGARFSL